jgi:glycosyltransferase involved in cell wall biosynthesis
MHIGLVTRGELAYALDLANALNGLGMSVTLYTCHAKIVEEVGPSDRPAERLYELGLLPQKCRMHVVRPPRMRDPRSIAVFRRLSHTIRDDGVDVAHILVTPGELWFAVLACLLRDVPVVSTMIVPKPNVGEPLPFFVVWAIYKLLACGSDMVIVNGVDQVALVQELYGIRASRIACVPLGVRTTAIQWSTRRVPEEPGTVLFFGRAHPHKGLEYLVRAQPIITHRIPHARFLVSAHGEGLERCKRMIQDSSRFELHEGYVPGDLLPEFFQRASLVVLPYLSAASSGVLMTAYGFGRPVVATRISGLLEYVEDGVTGLLVPPADVEQLAEAIIRLLSDDTLRRQMGENAARWANEELSGKNVAMQTLGIYERAIAAHWDGSR